MICVQLAHTKTLRAVLYVTLVLLGVFRIKQASHFAWLALQESILQGKVGAKIATNVREANIRTGRGLLCARTVGKALIP